MFSYGVDNERIKTVYKNSSTGASWTRKYAGNYEEVWSNGQSVKKIHYISGGDGLTAVYIIYGGGNDTMYYVSKDYLGNIMLLTYQNWDVTEEYSYDAWGRRRNPTNWNDYNVTAPRILYRGYTGHEHLDEFALINMNGRIYDPLISRFLSPDIFVQDPLSTQNYNRYTYCLNNPLLYTDPDGEIAWLIPVIMAALAGGQMNLISNMSSVRESDYGWDSFWKGAGYFGIGAAAGIAGAATGGTVAGAVGTFGFAAGALTGGTAGFTGGFIIGAGNAWMNGANLGSGLMSGLQVGAIGGIAGGLIGGIVGGINAVENGGKFWSGDGAIYESVAPADLQGDGFMFKNDEEMHTWLEGENVNLDDFGVNKLTAYENVDFTRGRFDYFRGDDGLIYKMNNKTFATIKLNGFTQLNGGAFSRTSDIFMSRFSDLWKFTGALNHELIHAYHISQALHITYGRSFGVYTERIAYEYGASIGLHSISEAYKYIPPPYNPIMPPYLVPLP